MIEAVIKQDLESINDLLRALADKYGQDFYFIGGFGIKGDESQGQLPMYSNISIIGNRFDLFYGIHNLLSNELGVEILVGALTCHCSMTLPTKSETLTNLRELFLLRIKNELIEKLKDEDANEAVQELLKNSGF